MTKVVTRPTLPTGSSHAVYTGGVRTGGQHTAAQVRAHLRRTVAAIADVTESAIGWTARSTELPHVHTLNQVHVTTPCAARDALALAESQQSHLGYRHLVVDVPEVAAALSDAVADWKSDREVLMALEAAPARGADTARVTELSEEETDALMRRWLEEELTDAGPEVFEQLAEYQRRESRVWDERRLGTRDDVGAAVALTKLRSDGAGTAWVEDVYTLPDARGRGHARALVTYAVEDARSRGHRLTFIVADDRDWPKELYADVGFRPVAQVWTFHRDLGAG